MTVQNATAAYVDEPFCAQSGDVSFAGFVLSARRRMLTFRGIPVSLTPKEFDLLVALIEQFGVPASRDDLILKVWSNKEITDYTLSQTVHRLRRSLANRNPAEDYIQTLPGFGYQFVAPVQRNGEPHGGDDFLRGPASGLMRAMAHLSAGSAADIAAAIVLFKRGLHEQPSYVPALLGLAGAYLCAADLALIPHSHAYASARRAIERAIRLAPVSGEAIALLAQIALFEHRDLDIASRLAPSALRMSPSSVPARSVAAWVCIVKGEWEEALRHVGAIFKMDPASAAIDRLLSAIFYFSGRYDEARVHAFGALRRNESDYAAILLAVRVLVAVGDCERAGELLFKLASGEGNSHAKALSALVASKESNLPYASRILEELATGAAPDCAIALALIGLQRFEEAANYVHRAADRREPQLLLFLRDPITSDLWKTAAGLRARERIETAVRVSDNS